MSASQFASYAAADAAHRDATGSSYKLPLHRSWTAAVDAVRASLAGAGDPDTLFDVQAIARETYAHHTVTDAAGNQLPHDGGWYQYVDAPTFWALVKNHERTREGVPEWATGATGWEENEGVASRVVSMRSGAFSVSLVQERQPDGTITPGTWSAEQEIVDHFGATATEVLAAFRETARDRLVILGVLHEAAQRESGGEQEAAN